MNTSTQNRLAQETSPYLQQHASNPVQWYPWGADALALAAEQDKPILLSIGYSACHWCHVMAHESFEDPAIAQSMNELFVNIKVDREERPDLDKIYQLAHAALNRRNGGWPLTMFLTPDELVPFFGGTYFPDTARHGLPGFGDVLKRVADYYRRNGDDVAKQSAAMRQFFQSLNDAATDVDSTLDAAIFTRTRNELEQAFDARHGGFGRAPKFPHPTNIDRALRHWYASVESGKPDSKALHIAVYTLEKMARGGVFDQLGGGFCRYSVDDYWMIPHFEKMLYDNGLLLSVYVDGFVATGDALFQHVVQSTAEWTIRDMQSAEGGYFSSLDADSDGEEGKYYRWQRDDVREILSEEEYQVFAAHFGLDQPPNFEGQWHLHTFVSESGLCNRFVKSSADIAALLDSAKRKLLEARGDRVAPGRDEKVLTAWNALMIKGMARAGRCLQRSEFVGSAARAVGFIRAVLWRDGRLLATYKDDQARLSAYLDDYAFLLDALLELLQARWRLEDLVFATRLADALIEHFTDPRHGGFFFTADDHERLLHRPKPLADEATPAGNGIAAQALNRLGHLLGETRYLRAAEEAVKGAAAFMRQSGMAHASLTNAYEEILTPPEIVILRGDAATLQQWTAAVVRDYAPHRLTFCIPADAEALPAALAEKSPSGSAVAYVCRGTTCSAPLTQFEAFCDHMKSAA